MTRAFAPCSRRPSRDFRAGASGRVSRLAWSFVLCLLCAAGDARSASGETRTGRITHIVDGATVELLVDNSRRLRVRLAGIVAPRPGQTYALRSRQSLVQICGGEIAAVEPKGKDRSGTMLARVTCNGTDANAEQVRRGFAHASGAEAPDVKLEALQAEARAAHRGLWSTQVPPEPR